MINVLLDPLPEEWETEDGRVFPINSDFRIGVQLHLLFGDPELTEQEKLYKMADLLGLSGISAEEVTECVKWFLGGWSHDNPGKKKDERLSDFDIDQWRIYAAFLSQYHIDLNEIEYLHFWAFMGLLTSLSESAFTKVVEIRGKKASKNMSKEDRKALQEAKETYRLGKIMTAEEKELEDGLYEFLGGKSDPDEERRIKEFESYGGGDNQGGL